MFESLKAAYQAFTESRGPALTTLNLAEPAIVQPSGFDLVQYSGLAQGFQQLDVVDVAKAAGAADRSLIPGSVNVTLPKPKPMEEIGVSGLLRTKGVGYVYDEWLPELSGQRAKLIYREMRDQDPILGAIFFALEMILRKAEWRLEPADVKGGEETSEFVKECQQDCSHTWEDFIAEGTSMFTYGFALFETVHKRRLGPKGKTRSKFNDGKIGWRKFAPRAQESILYWIWDDEGGLQGCVQLAAPDYHNTTIPIEKLLLLRTTSNKNNPEGRSVLRNCFRPYWFKRRIEEVEGIGIERDLCGLPVLYTTAEGQAAAKAMGVDYAKLVTNIRRDDQMGIVLPQAFDEKGNPHVKLELLSSGGGRQADPSATIARYNKDMLNSMLAGFIQVGDGDVGSFALANSKTRIFSIAIAAYMDGVAAVFNEHAIPRLLELNHIPLEQAPKLVPGDIEVRDLEELGSFINRCATSGMTFDDEEFQNWVRKQMKAPLLPEGHLEEQQRMQQQMGIPGKPGAKPGVRPVPGGPAPPATDEEQQKQKQKLKGAA